MFGKKRGNSDWDNAMDVLNQGRKFEEQLEKEEMKEAKKRSKGWPIVKGKNIKK